MSDTLTPPTSADAPDGDGGRRRGRSRIAPFVALAIAAVFALLFVVFARSDSREAESADTRWLNQAAPETRGPLAGTGDDDAPPRMFDLAQRSGSWVVINFFDSTCGPCVAEHPQLVDFDAGQDGLGAEQIELVSVLWGNDPARSFEYLQDNGLDWDVVYDDGSIANRYGVTKVPETWIIDDDGYVRRRYIGEVNAQLLIDTVSSFRAPAQ